MWESRSDFQGRWEGWKNLSLVFQAFHGPSFPRLGSVRFGSLLLLVRGSAEAIRFRAGLASEGHSESGDASPKEFLRIARLGFEAEPFFGVFVAEYDDHLPSGDPLLPHRVSRSTSSAGSGEDKPKHPATVRLQIVRDV